MSIQHLVRKDLKNFIPYSSARDESLEKDKIFLNANESPWEYTLSLEHMALNRYPDKQPRHLLPQLAAFYQVQEDQLLMLRGSDEAIDILIRLFCSAREDAILITPPTFGMYAVAAALQGIEVIEVPLYQAQDYQLNYADLLSNWAPQVKIVFLCSPNNPIGNLLNPADVVQLCHSLADKSIVVIDEAYIEFSAQESMTRYFEQCENLVVLRTFSKAMGLAGARCGFLLAAAEIIDWVKRIVPPYPLPKMSIEVVSQALLPARLQEVQSHITTIQTERARMQQMLMNIPCVKEVWPSAANYLLIEVMDADYVMQYCTDKGLVLRNFSHKPELKNCIRITIGKPDENVLLLKVLQSI